MWGHGSGKNCNGSAESGAEELRGLDTGEDREGAKDEVTPHGSLVPSLEPLPSAETNCAHTVCTVVGILPADISIRSRTKKDEDRSELSSWLDTSGSGAEQPGSSSSFRSKVRQGSQIVSTSSLSRGIAGARSFVEVRDLFRNKSEEGDAPA